MLGPAWVWGSEDRSGINTEVPSPGDIEGPEPKHTPIYQDGMCNTSQCGGFTPCCLRAERSALPQHTIMCTTMFTITCMCILVAY